MEVTAVDRFLLVWQTVKPITNISMFCFLFLLLQSSIKSQQIKPASWSRTSTQGPLTPYLYLEGQKLVMGRTQQWTLKHTPKKWVLKYSHCQMRNDYAELKGLFELSAFVKETQWGVRMYLPTANVFCHFIQAYRGRTKPSWSSAWLPSCVL